MLLACGCSVVVVVGSSSKNSLSQIVAERSAISGGLKVEGMVEGRGRKDGAVLAAIQWTGYTTQEEKDRNRKVRVTSFLFSPDQWRCVAYRKNLVKSCAENQKAPFYFSWCSSPVAAKQKIREINKPQLGVKELIGNRVITALDCFLYIDSDST